MTVIVDPANVDLDTGIIIAKPERLRYVDSICGTTGWRWGHNDEDGLFVPDVLPDLDDFDDPDTLHRPKRTTRPPAWVAEYDKPCETCSGDGFSGFGPWCLRTPCTDCHGSCRAVFQIGYRCGTCHGKRWVHRESGDYPCPYCALNNGQNGVVPLATVSITEVLPIVDNLAGRSPDTGCVEMVTDRYRREWYFTDDSPPSDPMQWHPPNAWLHRQCAIPAAAEPGDVAVFVTVHERHDHRKDEHP